MRRPMSVATRRSQNGITLVLISLIMLILIGMGAFSMDLNHQVLNKARLQNAVDSAALAAAVVADDTSDVDFADAAARSALLSFISGSGNQELGKKGDEGVIGFAENVEILITFSVENTKDSFFNASEFKSEGVLENSNDSDIYVRVAVSGVPLTQFLSYIFGSNKNVSASAVAGPSAAITNTCNISPIAMCGNLAATDLAWGYIPSTKPNYDAKTDKIAETVHVLKPSGHKDGGIGAGNYHLLDFGSGKNTVRDLLAGISDTCISVGNTVTTETGKGTGPVAQGLNTRFDTKSSNKTDTGEEIKSDKYLEESNVTYDNYESVYKEAESTSNPDAFYYADYYAALNSCESNESNSLCNTNYYEQSGQEGRRVLRVPIVNCDSSPKSGGKMDLEVLGIGCFFITQQVQKKGNESEIYGQFLEDCTVKNASTGIDPSGIGPYKIQLYKDPYGGAS
ncbi:pilus assembly protein TadG-related protein [Vibrio mytili]|uniref:pilus assembly protein TadG-related protein n=1 Tax=Vibrio mytili TaxID=50718 RepID=UPI002F41A505